MIEMHTLKLNAASQKPQSVKVFRAGNAEIVRTFDISLKAGNYEIQVEGLSNSIEADSMRVIGLGPDARLTDLVMRSAPLVGKALEDNEVIHRLLVKKQLLAAEKNVRQQEADLYSSYGRGLSGSTQPPSETVPFFERFYDVSKRVLEAVETLDEQIRTVDKALSVEREQQSAAKLTSMGVTLYVLVEKECQTKLKLTYVVKNASWQPVYDLYANLTENGKPSRVTFHYRARVTQSTGEDWKDTVLTLSTGEQSSHTVEVPKLPVYRLKPKLAFGGPPVQQSQVQFGFPAAVTSISESARSLGLFNRATQPAGNSLFGPTPVTVVPPQPSAAFGQMTPQLASFPPGSSSARTASQQPAAATSFASFGSGRGFTDLHSAENVPTSTLFTQQSAHESSSPTDAPFPPEDGTIVRSSPLSTSYTVEGAFTVPSDGTAHTVSISVSKLDAEITRVCVPCVNAVVMMQCKVQNTSEYHFLRGPVSIFLDDSFATRTNIENVAPKEHFECTLGVDELMRISYTRARGAVPTGHRAVFGANIVSIPYTARTTISNKHPFAVTDLIVRDALPVLRDDTDRIKVELKKPDGLAEAGDGQLIRVDEVTRVRWSKEISGKGGVKEGKYEWVVTVGAGKQVSLSAEWEITLPETTSYDTVIESS